MQSLDNLFIQLKRIPKSWFALAVFLIILIYTRFIGLDWGLPYPMHPDERNMAIAIEQISCKNSTFSECFNPHFFAYGQFPLYLSYLLIHIYKFLKGIQETSISFIEAARALRFISATAAVGTVWILVKMLFQLTPYTSRSVNRLYNISPDQPQSQLFFHFFNPFVYPLTAIFIFSPALIQFSHFGTTESLLMFLFTLIVYFSFQLLHNFLSLKKYLILVGFICGIAMAVKVSSLMFTTVAFMTLAIYLWKESKSRKLLRLFYAGTKFVCIVLFFFFIFSPYNIIDLAGFLGSMRYESDIATGSYIAFYTRQFVGSIPVLFQFTHIFPYALGWPVLILFISGFMFLPFNSYGNTLRVAFLSYFIPNAFLYAKWTRFMAPIFPMMLLFAALFLIRVFYRLRLQLSQTFKNHFLLVVSKILLYGSMYALVVVASLPGLAYLSIYTSPDVRFMASEWVFKNMPSNAYILSETANVVDIPISAPDHDKKLYEGKRYKYISFNFYNLDENSVLQDELTQHLKNANYIFIPSRRVFMNHTCMDETNPHLVSETLDERYNRFELVGGRNFIDQCEFREETYFTLNSYYKRLFSGDLQFQKVAEFHSYPKITLFGKTLLEFPDERAEESWTVFDHPVIRIYEKVGI